MQTARVLLISILENRDIHRIQKESAALSQDHTVEFLGRDDFPGGKMARLWRSAVWLAQNLRRFDVIHVHELFSLAYLPLMLLLRRRETKLVYEEREYARWNFNADYPLRTRIYLVLIYYLIRSWARWFFDAVIVISDEMRDIEWGGRAEVIWNYPDFAYLDSVAPNGKLDPRFVWLVHHGELRREKGVLRIPEMLARIGRDDVRALVIGDLADRGLTDEFHALAREHGVADRCLCIGRLSRAETTAWLKNDVPMIGVIPAEEAGEMSLTVFVKSYEFLYFGIPAVVSSHVRDFVDHIVPTGGALAAPAGDIAAHAAAARTLIAEHPERRAACLAARERFSWEHEAEKLRAIYRRLTA